MRWQIANEALSAELAITSLISNKCEWNNYRFIKFLKLQKFEVRNTSAKKRENPSEIAKKLDEDAMLCNTLWSDRLITKNISYLFGYFLTSALIQTFHKKVFFFLFWLYSEKNIAFRRKHF